MAIFLILQEYKDDFCDMSYVQIRSVLEIAMIKELRDIDCKAAQ